MNQPLLSSLLSQVQAAEDLRRPLWGALEALQAVARCLTHPREVILLACQVAQLGRQALTTGAVVLGLEDAAQAAEDAATQHEAARELYLSECELCRALLLHRAGHPLSKVHLLSSLRALSRAIERIGERPETIAYLVDMAERAFLLGEERVEEEGGAPPPEGPAPVNGVTIDAGEAPELEEGTPELRYERDTMNRRAAA